jgi:hypothetical protein
VSGVESNHVLRKSLCGKGDFCPAPFPSAKGAAFIIIVGQRPTIMKIKLKALKARFISDWGCAYRALNRAFSAC